MSDDLFKIVDAKPEDVEAMRTIVRDAWLELYPNEQYGITREDIAVIDFHKPEDLEKRRRDIIEKLDRAHTWVLRNDKGEIGGFCKAFKFGKIGNFGEINGMYVLKEIQGKGLGKKLIQKAFEWIGPDLDIKLTVVVYNTNAIEFYKKMGFKETENKVDYDGTELPGGKDIPRIEMLKHHA